VQPFCRLHYYYSPIILRAADVRVLINLHDKDGIKLDSIIVTISHTLLYYYTHVFSIVSVNKRDIKD